MYKGYIDPDSLLKQGDAVSQATNLSIPIQAYGAGNFLLLEGDSVNGKGYLKKVIDSRYWAAMDYIAAEADLARLHENQKDSL